MTVELDADLVDQLSALLKPLGLTPDDYFQMCINYIIWRTQPIVKRLKLCLRNGEPNNFLLSSSEYYAYYELKIKVW